MSGRGKVKQEPMKVVFINTQYVETDARSFKNVVQELTGKDAIVAAGPYESPSAYAYDGGNKSGHDTRRLYGGGGRGGVETTTEFDRFFKEMPAMEEFYKLCKHSRLSPIRSQLRRPHPFSACIPDSYSSRSPNSPARDRSSSFQLASDRPARGSLGGPVLQSSKPK
uniref:VQ domain-containing protein n=1 Tax=Brassica oleracea var. oleracea TaxID=109376 RepID=A0A0D3ARG4_BRAOL